MKTINTDSEGSIFPDSAIISDEEFTSIEEPIKNPAHERTKYTYLGFGFGTLGSLLILLIDVLQYDLVSNLSILVIGAMGFISFMLAILFSMKGVY